MRVFASIAGSLLGATTFWMMWPAPFEPLHWDEPTPPEMTGPISPDDRLAAAQPVHLGAPGAGEGLAIDADGRVYFGTAEGRVGRLNPADEHDGWQIEDLAHIADTPIMGLQWIDDRTLGLAANSGLMALDAETLEVRSLSTGSPSRPFGFVNDLARAPDGQVYFTDSSMRWGHASDSPGHLYDMLENRPHGVLYSWDPVTRQTDIVAEGLYYPNGVTAMPDGQSVLVSESFRYTLRRVWIDGPRRGDSEIFADNLPGMPDGLHLGDDGRLYIAMLSQRSDTLRRLRASPFLTKMLAKLPRWLRPDGGQPSGYVLVMDPQSGALLDSFHDASGRMNYVSTVALAPDGGLWFGSTFGQYVARYDLSADADTEERGDSAGRAIAQAD